VAETRIGYTAGSSVIVAGGVAGAYADYTNGSRTLLSDGWFRLSLGITVFGLVVLLITLVNHFVSASRERMHYDPQKRSLFIALTPKARRQVAELKGTPQVSKRTPDVLQHKSLVITPRSMGTFAVMCSDEPFYDGQIEVRVRAYVANQPDSASATLSTARAAIQLDEYPIELVETHVGQYAPRGGEIPEGYTYPPVVPTGATLEIECAFWTRTQRSPLGGWIQPHGGVIVGFTLIDLFGVETRLPTEVEFSVSHVLPGWERDR